MNIYYLIMAVYGWLQWRKGDENKTGVASNRAIQSFSGVQHAIALGLIAILTLISGGLLTNTQAAFPYLDSFTTWAAVITTWMVAHKVLENWWYWIVINSVAIFLYLDRGFALYAALFMVYIVLSVIGLRRWRADYRQGALS